MRRPFSDAAPGVRGPVVSIAPDAEARAAAVRALLAGLPEWFGVPEHDARYAEAARRHPTWLAREGREVVGALTLTAPTEEACDVHLLAVRRDRHRRGVGRALLTAAEAHARGRGARMLTVRTLGPSRPSAAYAETRAFYRARGFAALAEMHGVWEGTPMLMMAKPVAPQEKPMTPQDPDEPRAPDPARAAPPADAAGSPPSPEASPPDAASDDARASDARGDARPLDAREDARASDAREDARASDAREDARHAAKMAKKKAARDKIMATKTEERGLVIVHTGRGKGKSSAAFGMIFRCIAHGLPCAVVQFIKGAMSSGERTLIEGRFSDLCAFHAMGEGFTWETQDRARDEEMAAAAWARARELIRDERHRMVLLDEINIALRYDYLDLAEVMAFLRDERPERTHVVLTGRNAAEPLIEMADLATEMTLVKHPFRSGVKAQPGVEF